MPRLTQVSASSLDGFRLRACHALWIHFPEDSTNHQIGNSTVADPTTPVTPKCHGFGLFRFRSPLLSESRFLSFPSGTEMVHFSGFAAQINSMDKPNGRLVLVSYTHYCASTSSLSTRWSSWTLLYPFGLGDLILGRASRLYAFSGYHNRTSLPSRALGRTTGTQEVRPSRSSRTKDSPPQISYAHSR